MRTTKKMLCILLSCILLLCTACSGGAENSGDNAGSVSDSEHAYEEYKIAVLPKMTGKYGYGYAGGRLYVLGSDEELSLVLMSSTDGITWEDASATYSSAIQNALGEGEALFGAAISEKEVLAWVANKAETETGSVNTIHVTDKNGADTVIESFNNTSIKKLLFSKDGETLYVCTKEEITAYGSDGSKKGNIQTSEYLDACVKDDDTIAVLKSQGICVYSLDGKMTGMEEGIANTLPDELAKLNEHIESDVLTWYSGFQCVGEYYYLLLESGIYKYKSGVLIERLVTQERNLFKENTSGIYALLLKEDEIFVLAGADKETAYVYTPEAQEKYVVELTTEENTEEAEAPEPPIKELEDGELTVYSLYDKPHLVEAAKIFEKNHPNVHVSLEIGIPEESGISLNDAIQALNVKLMSGNGPDVLIMDSLNIQKYISSGYLADLSDIYDTLINDYPGIFKKILNAFRQDNGQIFVLPTHFSTQVLVGKKEALSEISDIDTLYDYLAKYGDCEFGNELQVFYPEELFEALEASYMRTIIDDNGTYHEENLKAFISTLKDIWLLLEQENNREGQKNLDEEELNFPSRWNNINYPLCWMIEDGFAPDYLNLPKYNRLALGVLNMVVSLFDIRILLNDLEGYDMQIFSSDNNRIFEPCQNMALSSKTKYERAGKAFIEELYRNDIQRFFPDCDRGNKGGIPVRYAENPPNLIGGTTTINYRHPIVYEFPNKEQKEYFDNFFTTLDTPVYIDKTVESILEKDITDYLNDKITIDEYMDGVNERLTLYLKE